MSREVMQQALEALEVATTPLAKDRQEVLRAQAALRRELEKPAAPDDELTQVLIERDEYHEMADDLAAKIAEITGDDIGEHTSGNCPWRKALEVADDWINRPQPAREWVGLTDEEAIEIGTQCQWYDGDCERFDSIGFARAIEAKLKEKNDK